jgi:hypothetical protein
MSAFRDQADGPKSILLPLVPLTQWTWREIEKYSFVLSRNNYDFFEVKLEGSGESRDWHLEANRAPFCFIFNKVKINRNADNLPVASEQALLIAQRYIKTWFEKIASEM